MAISKIFDFGQGKIPVIVMKPNCSLRVTVWCGVTVLGIIGPYFFQDENGNCVTVNSGLAMLQDFVLPKDGATCHIAKVCLTFVTWKVSRQINLQI